MNGVTRFTLAAVTLLMFTVFGIAQDNFDRLVQIPVEAEDIGGYGNIVAGVDFDGDGLTEMYVVNNDWYDQIGLDLVPRIYKYERAADGSWSIVWSTRLALEFQNTWPPLAAADLDNDGKMEIVWGPINNTGGGLQPNPERIVVFETPGDGSDVMGIDNGDGTFSPNAQWTITTQDNQNIRPFRWEIADIDGDGVDEICAGARAGDGIQIYSVDNVPDTGDGSETWTLEFSGVGSTFYDMTVLNDWVVGIDAGGDVYLISYDAGSSSYVVSDTLAGLAGGGSWNSAKTVDVDGNGTDEIILASWSSGTSEVYLLQVSGDTLASSIIKDVPDASNRLYGGAAGDVDGDGNLDFVFGTRQSSPNGIIHRLEYAGSGDIADEANWSLSTMDQESSTTQQYDVVTMADIDGDGEDEVIYTGTPRGAGSDDAKYITILDRVDFNAPTISAVVDVPADQGSQVWVIWNGAGDDVSGTRMTADLSGDNEVPPVATVASGQASFILSDDESSLRYVLQVSNIVDVSAAHIHVGAPGTNGGVAVGLYSGTPNGPVNGVLASGVITEASLAGGPYDGNMAGFVGDLLSGGFYVNVHTVANPGGEVRGQILSDPVAGLGDGGDYTEGYTITHYGVWRVDAGQYPVQVAEVRANQFPAYAAVVPTLGDSLSSTYIVSAHTANVNTRWLSIAKTGFSVDNLAPQAPLNLAASSGDGNVGLVWEETDDTDVNYYVVYRSDQPNFDPPSQGTLVGTVTDLSFVDTGVSDGENWFYRVAGVDFASNVGDFSNEANAVVTGIGDNAAVPNEFALKQNYPNPFNPETTIAFDLAKQVEVKVTIYNVMGQEVRTLVDGVRPAGAYQVRWDGLNNNGARVASGTYIYMLNAGDFVQSKKMVLLK